MRKSEAGDLSCCLLECRETHPIVLLRSTTSKGVDFIEVVRAESESNGGQVG